MTLSTPARTAAVSAALAGTLALAGCGAANESRTTGSGATSGAARLSGDLTGAGSSAQQAAMSGWQAGFHAVQPAVTVNYDPVGSGGGRDQFLSGGTDFAGSDAALTADELTRAADRCGPAGVFELPNYISAIAVVYHLDGVPDLRLDPRTLAGIFSGAITTWNDPAIAADNPGAALPATTITPVHRGDKSGTTKNFTDYLAKTAPDAWSAGAVEQWPTSGGEAASQTSGMIAAIRAGAGTIGYADESQVGTLGVARVAVGSTFVAPSATAASAVVAHSDRVPGRGQFDLAVDVNRTTTSADEYPIVLVSYHIGCVSYPDTATADLVRAFEGYVISAEGQQAAAEAAGSAPISDAQRAQARTAVEAITAAG